MSLGSDRFGRWVDSLGGNVAAARVVGVTPAHVSLLRAGKRTPSLALSVRIERATVAAAGGPIRGWEWTEPKSDAA